MSVSFIVAASENGVIGRDEALPWHLPDDLKRFKKLTLGHAVVMGRLTYQSIGRPLPKRANIVLTCNHLFEAPGCIVVHSADEVLEMAAKRAEKFFVIGGEQVFNLFMPAAQRIHLTRVHADVKGDAHFHFDESEWELESREEHPADAEHEYGFTFLDYKRKEAR